jgi:serine phosphatase RsbU (regulator of sigma subunit)/Zn-finger nucleic acid-binding protein
MDCTKKNCRKPLKQQAVQLKEGVIHHFLCDECQSIWIDQAEVKKLNAGYEDTGKSSISEYACPRCKNIFLELTDHLEKVGFSSYQCRKCSGLRIDAWDKTLDGKDDAHDSFDSPLMEFLADIRLIHKREMHKKKINQLPGGFKVKDARKTDYKCPGCGIPLTHYHVFETNLERGADFEICDQCFGIWLDKEDLVNREEKPGKDKLTVDMDTILPTGRTCPKCRDTKLVSMKFKELDTIIDCCSSCYGTWLDGGELQEFCDYLGTGGQAVIDILVDNAIFRNPPLCRILDHFSRIIHNLEDQRMEQEKNLEQARDIQVRLLFQDEGDEKKSILPYNYDMFGMVSHWHPAQTVGGDYYDIIPFNYNNEDYLGICIADVSGKGLPASLLMANLQALLRSFAPTTDSPALLCTQLNTILHNNTTANKFITFFYGVLNLAAGAFTYTNAGHNPPVFLSDGKIQWLKKGGTVLSFFPEWEYTEETIVPAKNDRILLYTDGVSEAENPKREEFSEARLAWLLKEYGEHTVMETMQLLVRDIREYNQGVYRDDTTLLLLERNK